MQPKSASLFLIVALFLAGCQGTLSPPEPPPHRGVELTVACPASLVDLAAARSRVWEARQQARVNVKPYTEAPDAGADVWVVAPARLAASAATGKLAALPRADAKSPPLGQPFDWGTLLPEYREQLLLWDRVAYAVPLLGEAPVCVFRADRYADAAVQAAYKAWQAKENPAARVRELRGPVSWQDFTMQARFFHQHLGQPSLPPLPASRSDLDRLFYAVAAPLARRAAAFDDKRAVPQEEQFSFHFDQATGAPRIGAPGFAAALDLLADWQPLRPPGASATPELSFLEGRAVLCLTEASWVAEFQKNPALRDKVGVCQIPGSERYTSVAGDWVEVKGTVNRVPYLGGGGWLAVVPASSKHEAAAADLLAELAGPAGSLQTALEPRWAGPFRSEHLLRERWDAFDLDPARTEALRQTLLNTLMQHNIKNPVLCLRTPDEAGYRDALGQTLRGVLLEGKPAKGALQSLAATWASLAEKRGKDVHRGEYRLSLGLLKE